MPTNVEEEYLDVLQNIEGAIVGIYHQHPSLTDYQVDAAIEALGRTYAREGTGRAPTLPKSELSRMVYQAMQVMCDWRMGRESLVDEEGQPMNVQPVTVDVILSCLKRLRKSVAMWNKEGGSQGYLKYVTQFMP